MEEVVMSELLHLPEKVDLDDILDNIRFSAACPENEIWVRSGERLYRFCLAPQHRQSPDD
jgi:hypothetical protein